MKLNDERRRIAEENHALIYKFLRINNLDPEEYYGDMAEAYCMAVARYDPMRGSLSTLAFAAMRNRLCNIRKQQALQRTVPAGCVISLDKALEDTDGKLTGQHCLPDLFIDIEETVLIRIAFENLLRQCSDEELMLLAHIINKEESQRKAAEKYHVSQATFGRKLRAVKEKAYRILIGTQDD